LVDARCGSPPTKPMRYLVAYLVAYLIGLHHKALHIFSPALCHDSENRSHLEA